MVDIAEHIAQKDHEKLKGNDIFVESLVEFFHDHILLQMLCFFPYHF